MHQERSPIAELLRIKSKLLLLQGAPAAAGWPRITSGRRSTGRARKARCPGNCVPPQALPSCDEIKANPAGGSRSSSRPTTASPKASTRPDLKPPRRFWRLSGSPGACFNTHGAFARSALRSGKFYRRKHPNPRACTGYSDDLLGRKRGQIRQAACRFSSIVVADGRMARAAPWANNEFQQWRQL